MGLCIKFITELDLINNVFSFEGKSSLVIIIFYERMRDLTFDIAIVALHIMIIL